MSFDYTIKGWPATIEIEATEYKIRSCGKDDNDLVYAIEGQHNPHITIHGVNKEGPDDWRRGGNFHVRVSRTKVYEYDSTGAPNDFVYAAGPKKGTKGTGAGSAEQSIQANEIAAQFVAKLKKSTGY